MTYLERIKTLIANIPIELVDFSQERTPASKPTQASSNFITNKEQGDWAEKLVMEAINSTFHDFMAVHYGKNDDLVAGDDGFDDFYQEFQNELDTIGKRPDLLIFKKKDYRADLGTDISKIPHDEINDYVKKAIAGIEVRSSAFLIDKYEEAMNQRTERNISLSMALKDEILSSYSAMLCHPTRKKYITILNAINPDTIHATDFKVPGWHSSHELTILNEKLKTLKNHIKEIQKRDYLSITPKVEDIKVAISGSKHSMSPITISKCFSTKSMESPLNKYSESSPIAITKGAYFPWNRTQRTKTRRPSKYVLMPDLKSRTKLTSPSTIASGEKWGADGCSITCLSKAERHI